MNADRFFAVDIVDKFSRAFMLLFAGITLGAVLAFGYYYIIMPSIGATIALISLYCILFASYVGFTNSKREISKVEIFKDRLSFVFEKKHEISKRKTVLFKDIKSYKISPLTDKKNSLKENPDINKFSLRVFGFKTTVELFDGETFSFQDSFSDGVLVYSPSYVYRMIDIKRFIPDFPLVLENFESEKEPENFKYQFKYYQELNENLSIFKNKRYLACLTKYTVIFAIIAAIIALVIAYIIWADFKDMSNALMMLYTTFGILVGIMVPMWLVAISTSFCGGKFNLKAKNIIEKIIKE